MIVATEKEIAAADELVARLDLQTKQVLIEARLVELHRNPSSAKGIDWSATLQAQHFTFGNNVLGGQRNINTLPTILQTPTIAPNGTGGVTTNGVFTTFTTTFGTNNLVQSPGLLG